LVSSKITAPINDGSKMPYAHVNAVRGRVHDD